MTLVLYSFLLLCQLKRRENLYSNHERRGMKNNKHYLHVSAAVYYMRINKYGKTKSAETGCLLGRGNWPAGNIFLLLSRYFLDVLKQMFFLRGNLIKFHGYLCTTQYSSNCCPPLTTTDPTAVTLNS